MPINTLSTGNSFPLFPEIMQKSRDFKFNMGTGAKIALGGFGTSTFLNVGGSMALGAKSLFWQGIGRFAAVGNLVAMSFTTGLLIGRGIDFLPTYFGEPRVSRSLEDGLLALFGPAPVIFQSIL